MDFLSTQKLEAYAELYVVPFVINLVIAIAVFYFGRMIARLIARSLGRAFERANVDDSLAKFLSDLAYAMLLAVVVLAALDRLGVPTTSAIAIMGAAGLAIGLSLQGSLGNFAAGVMIIIFKPYKVGDIVTVAGHTGGVDSIKIFNTILITPDNRQIIVPNGSIIGGSIENLTALGQRRIDMVFGIGYDDDIKKAKALIEEAIDSDDRILSEPTPQIAVGELADNSVNFVVRPWVKVADYWDSMFYLNEKVKELFDANGISIPYPQRDIHLHQAEASSQKAA